MEKGRKYIRQWMVPFGFSILLMGCTAQESDKRVDQAAKNDTLAKTNSNQMKSEEEWKKELTPEQYRILREKGTEMPHSGEYNLHFEKGTYYCSGCNAPLFSSDSKFNAHCGWPSFDKAISDSTIVETIDRSHGMIRTEITCAQCGGHLGHVFNDGPTASGLRYCVNSVALGFEKE